MDDAFIFLATAIGGFAFAGVLLLRWRTQQAFTELGSLLHRATGEIEELVPSVRRTIDEMESEITALHCAIDDLRAEIKSIRAAAPPGVDHPPRAGADLTSPAPAVSPLDREAHRRTLQTRDVKADNAGKASQPWAHYYAEADTLCVLAGGDLALADIRTAPNGFKWRQSKDGGFTGCDIPNALDLLRDAGFVIVRRYGGEEQRRSFAFGNCNIDNPAVTREMVDRAAERMAASDEDDGA